MPIDDERVIASERRAIERLQTCVPLRSWEAALGLNQSPPDGTTVH